MVIALVCGLGAAAGTYRILTADTQKAEEPTFEVLVPVKDVLPNQKMALLKEESFKKVAVKRSALSADPDRYFKSFEEIAKMQAKYRLEKEQPMRKEDLILASANAVNATLKPGEVAAVVKVSADQAGQFIAPGDFVDVVATIPAIGNEPPQAKTPKELQNMEVLAVNSFAGGPQPESQLNPERVTLRASREQSEQLAVLADFGSTLRLVLRPQGDNAKYETPGFKKEQGLLRKEVAASVPTTPPPPPAPEKKPEPKERKHGLVIRDGTKPTFVKEYTVPNEEYKEPEKEDGKKPGAQPPITTSPGAESKPAASELPTNGTESEAPAKVRDS
jgi:Flp pilus assembly protein CpaB